MRRHRKTEKGNSMVEMALILLLLLSTILGTMELGRAMWAYHTLAASVKRGVRFAAVHGARCAEASPACPVSVGTIAGQIQQNAVGLDPSRLKLTFITVNQTVLCSSLSNCLSNSAIWPAAPANAVGLPIDVRGVYSFDSVLTSLWPGQTLGPLSFSAASQEVVQF